MSTRVTIPVRIRYLDADGKVLRTETPQSLPAAQPADDQGKSLADVQSRNALEAQWARLVGGVAQ